jgi:hypothetical protein
LIATKIVMVTCYVKNVKLNVQLMTQHKRQYVSLAKRTVQNDIKEDLIDDFIDFVYFEADIVDLVKLRLFLNN